MAEWFLTPSERAALEKAQTTDKPKTKGKAEVICSNCGKRVILEDYEYGEPCRFCGYKRTELIRWISKSDAAKSKLGRNSEEFNRLSREMSRASSRGDWKTYNELKEKRSQLVRSWKEEKPSRTLLFRLKKMVEDEEEGYIKYSQIREYAADEGFSDIEDLINKIMLDENKHREDLKRLLRPYL